MSGKTIGKLIVFEGISGTGKETQARLLHDYLTSKKFQSQIVFHPTPDLKEVLSLWRKNRSIDHISEVYLLLADRADRVRQVIKPALYSGTWVISLRSVISALVYQGNSADERKWILQEFSRFEPKPDLLVWFDIDPQKALERIIERHKETGEPLGKFETIEYLTEKRRKYKEVMDTTPHIRIDATKAIDEIHAEVLQNIDVLD